MFNDRLNKINYDIFILWHTMQPLQVCKNNSNMENFFPRWFIQWIECWPVDGRVQGLIPTKDICLSCGLDRQ